MNIERLCLHNFMCFSDYELQLAPRFNLIVGDNGKGKTTILNALSVGLGAAFLGFPDPSVSRGIQREEIPRKFFAHGDTVTAEPQFPSAVECSGVFVGHDGSWARQLTAIDGKTTRQDSNWIKDVARAVQQDVQDGRDTVLPAISYYGTGRLWVQLSQTNVRTLKPDTRFQGYLDCLNPASNEKRLLEWFKTNEIAALQKKKSISVLEACRKAICTCVADATHIYFDVSLDQLILEINGERVPFAYLSDGYRNMLAMAADIAVRCATLNPHLMDDASVATPGVVLIDEIDLHLHPKWQRTVVPDLMRAFPQIQFVATTHSPFVIQSLPAEPDVQLINLDDPLERDFQNKSIEDISEWIQGVDLPQRSQRYVQMMDKASQYFAMLKDEAAATDDQRQEARRKLEQLVMPYSDSPAYHAFIRMQELASVADGSSPPNPAVRRRKRGIDLPDADPGTTELNGGTS